jgi:hypothetical protein
MDFLPHERLIVYDSQESLFEISPNGFAEKGIATLRFDFRGTGIMKELKDTTFNKQILDAVPSIDLIHLKIALTAE